MGLRDVDRSMVARRLSLTGIKTLQCLRQRILRRWLQYTQPHPTRQAKRRGIAQLDALPTQVSQPLRYANPVRQDRFRTKEVGIARLANPPQALQQVHLPRLPAAQNLQTIAQPLLHIGLHPGLQQGHAVRTTGHDDDSAENADTLEDIWPVALVNAT